MPQERRVSNQEARIDGRRDTDYRLTTKDCAERLGVSTNFMVGEILEGRLRALVIRRPGRRRMYRIAPADLKTYLRQYGPWTRSAAS